MRRTLFLYGATCLLGQILALRELVVLFHGNELVYGVILALWLLLFTVGNAGLGRIAEHFRPGGTTLAILLAVCGLLVPLTIAAIRIVQNLPIISMSEFTPAIVATALTMAPLCLALGFFHAVAYSIATRSDGKASTATTRVYIFEALGAFVAGILFISLFIHLAGGFILGLALAAMNCLAAFVILRRYPGIIKTVSAWTILGIAILLTMLTFTFVGRVLDFASRSMRFPGSLLLDTADTTHGRVDAVNNSGEIKFYQTGLMVGTSDDSSPDEESILLGLLAHPAPRQALIVGDTANLVQDKALLLPWLKLDHVDLDGELLAMALRRMPEDDPSVLESDRIRLITNMDGRDFIKRVPDRYDVILSALPPPATGTINRFYTVEYFKQVRRALHAEGNFALKLDIKPNSTSALHRALTENVYHSLKKVFPSVIAIPLDNAILFIATPNADYGLPNVAVWPQRMQRWNLKTEWLTPEKIAVLTQPTTIVQMTDELNRSNRTGLNRDMRPIAYLYRLQLWPKAFAVGQSRALLWLRKINLKTLAVALTLLCGLLCAVLLMYKNPARLAVPLTRGLTGLAGMGFQIVLIFALQSLYGNAYSGIAILFATFMLGLAAGTAVGKGGMFAGSELKAIMLFQVCLAVVTALAAPMLRLMTGTGPVLSFRGAGMVFPTLNFLAGAAIGVQYPLCITTWNATSESRLDDSRIASRTYAIEMLGACAGAAIGGPLLLPILGLTGGCLFIALVCLMSLPLIFIADQRRGW